MIDQYKEQYKKETEEIHAPAELIAKTKAAVRAEEMRLQREHSVQETAQQSTQAVKNVRGTAIRRWGYFLSAAAAVLILVSVSVMMRGVGKSGADMASYEMEATTEESAEAATEEMPEESAGAAEASVEESMAAADTEAGAAFDAGMALNEEGAMAGAEAGAALNREMDTESASATGGVAEAEAFDEAAGDAYSDELASTPKEAESSMSQKQESERKFADQAAVVDITVERVGKKPDFVDRAVTETKSYEDMIFQVTKEDSGWIAYVETENGTGYVIRGKAESLEAFLEAAYGEMAELK